MSNGRSKVFLGVLVASLLILAGCVGTAGAGGGPEVISSLGEDEAELRLLRVTGSGEATGVPDVAYITLGVESRDVDASVAVTDNTTRMQAVMEALKEFGLQEKDIRTVQYSMWLEQVPEPEPKPTPQVGIAEEPEERYHVVNQVRVTLRDLDKVGEVLEAAHSAGANTVSGISFAVEDAEALRQEARDKAITDAKAKAEQLASGLDTGFVRVHSIAEYGGPEPVTERAAMMEAVYGLEGGAVPVSAGEVSVTVNIEVAFELAD